MSSLRKKVVILGDGEIGTSFYNVLGPYFDTVVYGRIESAEFLESTEVDLLMIAFPYSDEFISEVNRYKEMFRPVHIVIVSTVPPGTSRSLGAVHSPVTGMHPYLEESICTFTRFLGGNGADVVGQFFRRAGLRVQLYDKQEATELAKLNQTTKYALNIENDKELKKQCNKWEVSFAEVSILPTMDYNTGYERLGYPEYKLPILQPIMTKQGGHCTRQNCDLWETPITEFIKKLNDVYET
jgi:hypothetical protein